MKSSIRSKLFLLVYGIILAFIVGLILLNNSFLENYYIKSRESSLVEAFIEVKKVDLDSQTTIEELLEIENYYNINIQILAQTEEFDEDFVWGGLDETPDIFNRIYGYRVNIPDGILTRIIYDFNQQEIDFESSYAQAVLELSDDSYSAYLMDIYSEFDVDSEDTNMIGLCVELEVEDSENIFYILTITFQSIQDSIKIFNSFTILVGFIFMVLAFIMMYFVSYSFTNPIIQINKIAEEIAGLNFKNRVSVKSDDEFKELGDSINRMSSQLEENIDELQKTNAKLAQEILHKTDVDKMRREFIANASHELKTPLSLIMGYTEALKLSGLDQEIKDEYIHIILDETNKMNALVMELLKLSQLESKDREFDFYHFNVRNLLEETRRLFSLVFEEKQVECEIDSIDKIVNSDYTQLQTVLTNFINNAINHIDDKLEIKLSAKMVENDSVRISVFNSGVNIPEEDILHIWDSFYKVDKARTRAYGGQGLGLSICKTTLELLGYDYGVINHETGIEFYFDIYKK